MKRQRSFRFLLIILLVLALAGCTSKGESAGTLLKEPTENGVKAGSEMVEETASATEQAEAAEEEDKQVIITQLPGFPEVPPFSPTPGAPQRGLGSGFVFDEQGHVDSVVADSPADKAGLRGSDTETTIDGLAVRIGGDIIVGIDGRPVREFDDLLSYIVRQTEVGQTVTVDILRAVAEAQSVEVKLEARPANE
jgi:S1-C subfamily serine protease